MADKPLCSIPGCSKKKWARGFCQQHYDRERHAGRLVGPPPRAGARLFLKQALSSETDECILWPFNVSAQGYGRIGWKILLHRYVCEQTCGPAPTGMFHAAHSCGTRRCINPRHIRWATPAENNADKRLHGTHAQGEGASFAKLTEDAVRDVRSKRESIKAAAARYGVSEWTIIELRRTRPRNWKHVA